jgi:hypothetical protein
MAISMRTRMNRTRGKVLFFGLAAGVGLVGAASCGSTDEAPLGRRVEHPDPRAPKPASSADGAVDASHPPLDGPFSPLDKVIAEDCFIERTVVLSRELSRALSRAWSQNVPDRDCTNDAECGDGFCDRGRCAAIWTCGERFGQHCVNGEVAPNPRFRNQRCSGICLEGRCRSCVSHEDCMKELGRSDARCGGPARNGERGCGVLAMKALWPKENDGTVP